MLHLVRYRERVAGARQSCCANVGHLAAFFPLPCFLAMFVPPLPRAGVLWGSEPGAVSSNPLCLGVGYRACLDASPMAAAFWVSFFATVTLFTATLMAWNAARARERRKAHRALDVVTSATIRDLAELRGPGSAFSPVYFASAECLVRAKLGVQMVVQGAPLEPDNPHLDVPSRYGDQDPKLLWSLALSGRIVSFVELSSAVDEALCSRFPVRGGRVMRLGAVRPGERATGNTWPPECGKRAPGLWVLVQWDVANVSCKRTLRAWSSRLGDRGHAFRRSGADLSTRRAKKSGAPAAESSTPWQVLSTGRGRAPSQAWVMGTSRGSGQPGRRLAPAAKHEPRASPRGPGKTSAGVSRGGQWHRRSRTGVPTLSLLPVYDMLDSGFSMYARGWRHSDACDDSEESQGLPSIPGAGRVYTGVYGLDAATGALHYVPCLHPLDRDSDGDDDSGPSLFDVCG